MYMSIYILNEWVSTGTFRAGTELQCLLVKLNTFRKDGKCFF